MTYEKELLEKKQKLEGLLADKIESRNWFAKKELEQDKNSLVRKGYQANKEDDDLIIECIQNEIDAIDKEIRNFWAAKGWHNKVRPKRNFVEELKKRLLVKNVKIGEPL